MTGLKGCKNCQDNVSLSLAKRKLTEKNEWKFSTQSGEVILLPNTSQIAEEASFFFSVILFRQ